MSTWAKLGIVALIVLLTGGVVLIALAPTLVREGRRVAEPIQRMKRSERALDDLVAKSGWKRPERDALTAEQLDRFFAARQRIDAIRRREHPTLDRLSRKQAQGLAALRQVPAVIGEVSEFVGGELDALVEARIAPEEYHWIERLVYQRWRGALRAAGSYPLKWRAAADAVEEAAAQEKDARVRARLEAVAGELRRRAAPPPEGFDPEIHALLVSRVDDVERWSMDDIADPAIPVPR
jgi:hypothetical protein